VHGINSITDNTSCTHYNRLSTYIQDHFYAKSETQYQTQNPTTFISSRHQHHLGLCTYSYQRHCKNQSQHLKGGHPELKLIKSKNVNHKPHNYYSDGDDGYRDDSQNYCHLFANTVDSSLQRGLTLVNIDDVQKVQKRTSISVVPQVNIHRT
jgi:hypothetical protein